MESDEEKRRNVVCAPTAEASQVTIVLSSNTRYRPKGVDMEMSYFRETNIRSVRPSQQRSLSLFLLALLFFFRPSLCALRGH